MLKYVWIQWMYMGDEGIDSIYITKTVIPFRERLGVLVLAGY